MLCPERAGNASRNGRSDAWKVCRRFFIVAVMAIVVLASRASFAEPMNLKMIYFIPKNRNVRESAIVNMRNFIKVAQEYYSTEMAKQGYFQPGTTKGKTFTYEKDENGEPAVHIIYGNNDDTYYQPDRQIYWMAQNEVWPYYTPYGNTLLIWCETWGVGADGSILGGACGGQSNGATGGIATMTADALINLDMAKFSDTTPYDGLILPEFSSLPMKYGVTYPDFCGRTIGQLASTAYGSICHEIGHSFGLLHNFYNDTAPVNGGNLMGNGCRGFRGNYGGFPGEFAVLDPLNAELLDVNPYFNPDVVHDDYSSPYFSSELSLTEPINTNWKLHIKVNASDYGSGLHRSFATAIPPWSPVASAPFNNGVADYYVTKDQIPCPWDTPKAYSIEVNAVDNQGNDTFTPTWVPSYSSGVQSKIQYANASGVWTDLKTTWSTTNNMRLAITMVAPDNSGSMRYELEMQPSGTPFTGNPNYYGEWVSWSGTAVANFLPLNLAGGKYHYRYRIRAGNWTTSCWMVKGGESAQSMSFGIDSTPPTVPTVTDSGQYTDKTTSLSASWSASDPESGVANYLIAVGTTPYDPGSGYVSTWRSSTSTSGSITGLSLVNGTKYYIYVKARNGMATYGESAASDGITVRTDSPQAVSVAQAKALPDGSYVKIQNLVTSCGKTDLGTCFYLEQADRSAGLKISTQNAGNLPDFAPAQLMTVTGLMATVDGERAISLPELTVGSKTDTILPVGLNLKAIGGGNCGLQKAVWNWASIKDTTGIQNVWKASNGLSNIGLLVKIAGKVTQIDPAGKYFYINDGSSLKDNTLTGQTANIGVRVAANPAGYTTGQMLVVTGISSCTLGQDGNPIRLIRVSNTSDIKPLQ